MRSPPKKVPTPPGVPPAPRGTGGVSCDCSSTSFDSACASLCGSRLGMPHCTAGRRGGQESSSLLARLEGRSRYGDRLSVVARVAGAELHARPRVVEHGLAVAEVRRARRPQFQLVPEPGELCADLFGDARLDLDVTPLEGTLGETARLQRLLDAHPVVDHVDHELRVRLRLVPAAHDAESDLHLSLL